MPERDLIQQAEKFKAALEVQDLKALGRIVEAYAGVQRRLRGEMDALLLEIEHTDKLTAAQVVKLERYRRLMRETQDELNRFSQYLGVEMDTLGRTMVGRGLAESRVLMELSLGDARLAADLRALAPETVETLLGFLDRNGPLYARLGMLTDYTAEMVSNTIVQSVALGRNPRVLARELTRAYGMGLTQSLNMARTVQLWSYREASRANYVANSNVVMGWIWQATLSDRTCMSCIAMHGTRHAVDEVLNDHHAGRCLTPGMLVSSPSIMAFESRRYDGEIVGIRTASGKFISVTPNHPILTDHGWLPAYLVQKGDNVVCDGGGYGASLAMHPNKNDVPTRIEDIPAALGMDCFASVPETAQNFHGDGIDGNIYVVGTNSLLLNTAESPFSNPLSEHILGSGGAKQVFLSPLCDLDAARKRWFSSCRRDLCDSDSSQLLIPGRIRDHHPIRLGPPSMVHSGIFQPEVNNIPGNSIKTSERIDAFAIDEAAGNFIDREAFFELFDCDSRDLSAPDFISGRYISKQPASLEFVREALLGSMKPMGGALGAFSRDISIDGVLEVCVTTFSGQVYNLQTTEDMYNVNGIITHNCAAIPITILNPRMELPQTGEQWFNSLTDAEKVKMMGQDRLQAYQDGKFKFNQLTREYDDEVYGKMRGEASLKDLLTGQG